MRKLIFILPFLVLCISASVYVPHRGLHFRHVWQPTDYPNMIFWYKADSLVGFNVGDAVGAWSDSSPNGYDISQVAPVNMPYYTNNASRINSKPFLYFDGNDNLWGYTAVYSQPTSIFVVGYAGDGSAQRHFYDGTNAISRNVSYITATYRVKLYAGTSQESADNATSSSFVLYEYIFNNPGSQSEIYINGTNVFNKASPGTQPLGGVTIGANSSRSGNYIIGGIAEVIAYNSVLNSPTEMIEYVQRKYGAFASW